MLGYNADCSLSSIDINQHEYVPASSEEDSSDGSSELSSQKRHRVREGSKLRKLRNQKNGSDGFSGAKTNRQCREASLYSREEDSDEPRLKTGTQYKRNDKGGSSSRVEDESDDSASIKRKKNRNTYTRCKKSDNPQSVKKSDSLVVADVPAVDGSKKYHRKKNYCIFCREPQLQISCHLERKHGDKMEVANAVMYAKKKGEIS